MDRVLLVALGGAAGSAARYLAGISYLRAFGPGRGWLATMTINVLGGLLMGVLASTLALRGGVGGERLRLLLGVGVLGGFTTFSTFSLEAVTLLQKREFATALGYVAASTVLSIAALAVGMAFARRALAS